MPRVWETDVRDGERERTGVIWVGMRENGRGRCEEFRIRGSVTILRVRNWSDNQC
jgi:hypothetical protein